uniref:PDZ domain-containing protein n=1 Tax=Heterorhabditis bacteriophora TaxID=37862 RepID=A0A1I7WVT6_HETBA
MEGDEDSINIQIFVPEIQVRVYHILLKFLFNVFNKDYIISILKYIYPHFTVDDRNEILKKSLIKYVLEYLKYYLPDILFLLLIHVKILLEIINLDCTTAINTSGIPSNRSVLVALIGGGAHIDFRNSEGQTAMHKAAFLSSLDNVRTLIELGASPNYRDPIGLTPLYYSMLTADSNDQRDYLLEIDGFDVRSASHDQVVQLIQQAGDTITLKVSTNDFFLIFKINRPFSGPNSRESSASSNSSSNNESVPPGQSKSVWIHRCEDLGLYSEMLLAKIFQKLEKYIFRFSNPTSTYTNTTSQRNLSWTGQATPSHIIAPPSSHSGPSSSSAPPPPPPPPPDLLKNTSNTIGVSTLQRGVSADALRSIALKKAEPSEGKKLERVLPSNGSADFQTDLRNALAKRRSKVRLLRVINRNGSCTDY